MRLKARIFLLPLFCYSVAAMTKKEICKRCVKIDECHLYKEMTPGEQRDMLDKFSCKKEEGKANTPFGFSPVAKGDNYVCCPEANVWGIEHNNKENYREQPSNNDQSNQGNDHVDDDSSSNENYSQQSDKDAYEPNRWPNRRRPHHRFDRHNHFPNPYPPKTNVPNNRIPTHQNIRNFNYDNPNANNPQFNGAGNVPQFNGAGFSNQNVRPLNPGIPNGNFIQNPGISNGNGNFIQNPGISNGNGNFIQNPGISNGNGNFIQNTGANQCNSLTSIPPAPESGCCGFEVSRDSIGDGNDNGYMAQPAQNPNSGWGAQATYPQWPGRFTRAAGNEKINITLDNRIIGGKETELEQFPWTVLLRTTFDYGDKKSAFNCGGSLISARYVLSAAHCMSEENAKVESLQVNLAEYDKRTFPRDCVRVPGEGQKCIENVVMEAEEIFPHPGYDDMRLQNDIGLIRLRENVPYTDFIRPICLPPIDIDNPKYSDLRLAVAGWGRNGEYTSQVKQSTVVNLVPQNECAQFYSQLTRKHLCAAGHSGEDTCKGDSGGPLMMLYKGQYFVSGVVSGKRSDSPCGTTVPSLYTNVYHYVDWIVQNVRD